MEKQLKILVVPANEGGCSYYRAIAPYMKLAELHPDKVQVRFDKNPLGMDEEGEKMGQWKSNWDFESIKWAHVVMTQNILNFGGPYTARVVGKAKEFGKFVHYDTDDLLTELYSGHRLEEVYEQGGLSDITKFIYHHSDLVSVTQKKFASRIQPFLAPGNILCVIKNAIDYNLPCWNVPRSTTKGVCRIGWAGGIHHEEDVKEFKGVPHRVNQRVGHQNLQWQFYGKPPEGTAENEAEAWQADVWKNYERIIMHGAPRGRNKNWTLNPALPPDAYGGMFAHMDFAIAPLQMNAFNDSKSEIKIAECGRYRIPLIASNVGCYDETIINGETGFLLEPDAPQSEWVKVLVKVIKNKKLRERMGNNLHEITEQYFDLNKTTPHRLDLYDRCFEDKSVTFKMLEANKPWT